MFYIYLKLYNLIFYIYISARNYWLQLIIIMPLQSPHLTLSVYDYDIVLTIFVVFFAWELPTLITSIVTKCSCFQKSFSNVQIYIININIRILLLHVLPVKGLLLMTYYYNSTNLILLLYMYILIGTTICPACTYSLYSQVSIITIIQITIQINVCSPFFKEMKLYRPLFKCYGFHIMIVIMCNSNKQMIYQILMRFILYNSTLPIAIFCYACIFQYKLHIILVRTSSLMNKNRGVYAYILRICQVVYFTIWVILLRVHIIPMLLSCNSNCPSIIAHYDSHFKFNLKSMLIQACELLYICVYEIQDYKSNNSDSTLIISVESILNYFMYVDVILEFKCSLPFPDFKLVIVILHDISEATYDGAISSGECKHKPLPTWNNRDTIISDDNSIKYHYCDLNITIIYIAVYIVDILFSTYHYIIYTNSFILMILISGGMYISSLFTQNNTCIAVLQW